MSKALKIEVGGKSYPCRLTMGAMLLYKENTGEDVSQLKTDSMENMLWLIWSCIVCACKADGIEFGMDFEMFTCSITPQEVAQWNEMVASMNEKKSEG